MLQISHLKTTVFHPQCNGQAERANQTIIKYLTLFTDDSTLDWEDVLLQYFFPLFNQSYALFPNFWNGSSTA